MREVSLRYRYISWRTTAELQGTETFSFVRKCRTTHPHGYINSMLPPATV